MADRVSQVSNSTDGLNNTHILIRNTNTISRYREMAMGRIVRGSSPSRNKGFFFFTCFQTSRLALRPIQPSMQLVPVYLQGNKRPGGGGDVNHPILIRDLKLRMGGVLPSLHLHFFIAKLFILQTKYQPSRNDHTAWRTTEVPEIPLI